jgi:hypothetical protein
MKWKVIVSAVHPCGSDSYPLELSLFRILLPNVRHRNVFSLITVLFSLQLTPEYVKDF